MRTLMLLVFLPMAACGPSKPLDKETIASHVRAYEACASTAKTEVQLENCAYAVMNMN